MTKQNVFKLMESFLNNAKLVCGVPQGFVLETWNFCMYMYPIGSILRLHCINYHIYVDDTQLYIKFDLSDPSIALEKN